MCRVVGRTRDDLRKRVLSTWEVIYYRLSSSSSFSKMAGGVWVGVWVASCALCVGLPLSGDENLQEVVPLEGIFKRGGDDCIAQGTWPESQLHNGHRDI